MLIPIENIRQAKIQLRPVLKQTVEYHELLNSIKVDGILQPILVRPVEGDSYEVIEGNWRYHAATDAGLSEMPCLVREATDEEVEVIQVKAQAIRPETPKSELAKRLHLLMERRDMSIGQLSRLTTKAPNWIRKILSLTRLLPEAQKMVDRGEITMRNAVALGRLKKPLQVNFLAHAVILSPTDFEEMVRRAVKDYRQCAQQDMTTWLDYRDSHYVAYLRQLKEIEDEIKCNRAALRSIRKLEATTPLDGWRACLTWIYHIDPDSLSKQKAEKEVLKTRRLSFDERRKHNEFTLKELRNISPEINYEH